MNELEITATKQPTITPRIPHTIIWLLIPVEGIGILVLIIYAASHWAAFIQQSTAIFSWLVLFSGLALYTALAWMAVKVLRSFVETVIAFTHAIADVHGKFMANKAVKARVELLHTDPGYVVYRVAGKITVQAIVQDRPTYNVRQVEEQDELTVPADELDMLPAPVRSFHELLESGVIQAALAQGKMLLGYAAGELRYGSWLDLYSCGIGGVSGSGKTTTVRFLLFQAILAGARMLMIDPHIGQSEESLAAQFKTFKDVHLMPPCDETPGAIVKRVRWLMKEYLRRKAVGMKPNASPLIFVLDEFNAIIRRLPEEVKKELADLLLTIAQEGRKFGIFALVIAQRWSENDLGGKNFGAAIRSSLAATLAHRFTDEDQAKKLIGGRNGSRCLELEQGHYLFRDTNGALSEMETPYTVESDGAFIQSLLDRNGTGKQPEHSQNTARTRYPELTIPDTDPLARNLLESGENTVEKAGRDTEQLEVPGAALYREKIHQILRMQAEGKQKGEIIKALWGVSPGGSQAYETANNEYQCVMKMAYEKLGA